MTRSRKSRKSASQSQTAIVYCRVSALDSQRATDADNSLEQQERVLTAAALAAGYVEVRVIHERHTASKRQPELEAALADLAAGSAAALYAAKIDRLSRRGAGDVLRIADLADAHGWRLVVADVALDTSTPVGRLVLTVMAGVSELESRRRSERMAEYHAARRARGEVAGVTYGMPTTASEQTIRVIAESRKAGWSWRRIAEHLTATGADGRRWHPTAVRRVHASPAAAAMMAA